jgi:hypothetical protein
LDKEKGMTKLMSVMFSAVMVVCLLVVPAVNAHEGHGTGGKKLFTKHFQETLFDITPHAAFSVEVILNNDEYKIGQNVIGIVVHNAKDEDVVGAKITLGLKNIETGASESGPVSVVDKHNGLYIVSGLDLKKAGRWELSVTVKKGDTEDGVKFILPDALKKPYPKGRYSP